VSTFDLALPGRLRFGPGRADELAGLLGGLGSRFLLVTGSDPDRHRALLGDVVPVAVVRQAQEPTVDDLRAALAAARDARADAVVAIGGGSVLDLGKTVAALLGGGDPADHVEIVGGGRPVERAGAPCVAVPTTAGTGAEMTANAPFRSPEHGLKSSIRGPGMLPTVALVDPLLTLGCPPAVTASSGLDALTQCLEPYVSPKANPATDAVAAEGLRRGARSLQRAYEHGDDRGAREDMALCSVFGGVALANAKLGAVHGIANVVGGVVDAPHGAVCATLLAPVAEANVAALARRDPGSPALERYTDVARLLTGRADATVDDGVAWLRALVAAVDVPPLGAVGLEPDRYREVAGKAARSSSMQGNPVVLTEDELVAVLEAAS
jgi:alcohol dehydrogenase class IV